MGKILAKHFPKNSEALARLCKFRWGWLHYPELFWYKRHSDVAGLVAFELNGVTGSILAVLLKDEPPFSYQYCDSLDSKVK